MIRLRLAFLILAAFLLALAAPRQRALGAEKKETTDETKPPEKKKKKTSKESDSKKSEPKTTKTPKPANPPAPSGEGGKSDATKDVTDQKATRTKEGGESRDSKTMENRGDSEFERELPSDSKPGAPPRDAPSVPKADLAGWEVVHYLDRDYITSTSIHRFYRFAEHRVEGDAVWFISPVLIMKGVLGSQDLLINNIKFVMSYPVAESGGKILFSRLDLCKLIDPVLRPSYIGSSNTFETVIIDAGHGGHDSGARGIYGYEKDFALKLALELKTDLEKRGLKVVLTRKDDTFISLGGRVDFANKIPNSIFIALHFNSGGSTATGIETYALSPQGSSSIYGARSSDYLSFHGNQRDSENIALATAVHAAVVHHFKMVDRGVKRARWYVLTGLERPGILFEGGFVTNAGDARLIAASNFRTELAHTIGDAVMNYRRALKPPPR